MASGIKISEISAMAGLRRLRPYVRANMQRLGIGLFCSLIAALADFVNVWTFGKITDSMNRVHPVQHYLNLYAEWLIVVFAIRGICSYGQTYFVNSASQRVLFRLRNDLYEHLQRLGIRFFDSRKTGQLMASITADIPQIQNAVGASIVDFVSAPFIIVVGIALAIYYNWRLALLAVVIIPVMATLITLATKRMRRATHLMQNALADISSFMEETLACIRVVKAFVTEDEETVRFHQRSRESLRAYMRGVRIQAALRPLIDIIGALGITLAVWMGEQDIIHHAWVIVPPHQFTFGNMVMFIGTIHYISQGFRSLGGLSLGFQQANVASERVFAMLDEEPDIQDRPGAVPLGPVQGRVEFRNVTFAYNTEPVIRNVSFEIEPGQAVAIVGPSGAGKSTIANLIPRFYEVTDGAILVDGHDVRDVTAASLRRQIGIVPQESVLFGVSIKENISYGTPEATDDQVRAAAKAANALAFIEALPDGFQTIVGQRGATLSGGQRQRVAIARAILRNPRILLLDEATSSLDAQSEHAVQAALDVLMQGRTTLIVAHRLSTIQGADRILVLADGEIVEDGSHAALIRQNGLYASLYHHQTHPAGQGDRLETEAPALVLTGHEKPNA